MVYIITKSRTSRRSPISDFHTVSKDELHDRRKVLESELDDGILSKDQMDMKDCTDSNQENQRVAQYVNWKDKKTKGVSNDERMTEWSNLNREMKARGEEGRPHCVDDIRSKKKVNYD